jgi:hypothetical protein
MRPAHDDRRVLRLARAAGAAAVDRVGHISQSLGDPQLLRGRHAVAVPRATSRRCATAGSSPPLENNNRPPGQLTRSSVTNKAGKSCGANASRLARARGHSQINASFIRARNLLPHGTISGAEYVHISQIWNALSPLRLEQ